MWSGPGRAPTPKPSPEQGCDPSRVVVVEQAVSDEAALRVQGPALPAQEDLAFRTHLPGVRLPQGTRFLPRRLQPLGTFPV